MDWPVVGTLGLPDGVRWDQIRSSDGREGDAEVVLVTFICLYSVLSWDCFFFLWKMAWKMV